MLQNVISINIAIILIRVQHMFKRNQLHCNFECRDIYQMLIFLYLTYVAKRNFD